MDSVIQWDANKVYSWLASIGFPAYEKQFKGTPPLALSNELNQAPPFPLIRASHTLQPPIHRLFVINIAVRTAHVGIIVTNSLTFITLRVHLVPITLENGITGDVLVNLDHEALKDLSIRSVGKRMAILKAIYNLKVAHNVPILEGDYVPPSIEFENDWLTPNGAADFRKIESAFQERDSTIKHLVQEISKLSTEVTRLREEMIPIWKIAKENKPLPVPDSQLSPLSGSYAGRNNNNNSNNGPLTRTGLLQPSNVRSPTQSQAPKDDYQNMPVSPHSPLEPGSNRSGRYFDAMPSSDDANRPKVNINDGGAIKVYGEKISSSSKIDMESPKSFRVSLDDPCNRVVQHALKKYKIVDDWKQYQLWIQYGTEGDTHERPLNPDEKPLRVFQKLKDANQNPFFTMKHIKDSKFVAPLGEHNPTNNSSTGFFKSNASKSNLSLQKDLPPSPMEKHTFGSNTSTISLSLARSPTPPLPSSTPTPTSASVPYGPFPSHQTLSSVDSVIRGPPRRGSSKKQDILEEMAELEDALSNYTMEPM